MNCEESQKLIDAYVDRELDLVKGLELERHLSECSACSEQHASLLALRTAISAVYYTTPASLQRRVTSEIRKVARSGEIARVPRVMTWRWIGVAASVALLLI